MRRFLVPVILLIVLAVEGVAMELLPPFIKFADIYIVPHWILILLILYALFHYSTNEFVPIVYAAIFGLMIDIVYTGILGVYMFVLSLSLYVAHLLNRLFQTNLLMIVLISTVSIFIMEMGLLAIYSFLGFTTISFSNYLIYRLIPTLFANLLFLIVIYYPAKKFFAWTNIKE